MLECTQTTGINGSLVQQCTSCGYNDTQDIHNYMWDMYYHFHGSTQQWLDRCQSEIVDGQCPYCRNQSIASSRQYDSPPPVVAINTEGQRVPIDTQISIETDGGNISTYVICGVVYLGDFHFVSRIVDKNSTIWYYDGASSEAMNGMKERQIKSTDSYNLLQCRGKQASLVLYVLDRTEQMSI